MDWLKQISEKNQQNAGYWRKPRSQGQLLVQVWTLGGNVSWGRLERDSWGWGDSQHKTSSPPPLLGEGMKRGGQPRPLADHW